MTRPGRTRWPLLAGVAVAAGCGSEPPPLSVDGGDGCPAPASERLLPLAVGTSWTYEVSEPKVPAEVKTSTVEAFEDIGGTKLGVYAFRVRTEKLDGVTVSWQEDTCGGVLRHREQSFDLADALISDQFYVPGKPRVDETAERIEVGATWVGSYTEVEEDPATGAIQTQSKSERWTVEAVDEEVTVPAGTFAAIRLLRVGEEIGQAEKRFWFAAGVGKVKEEGEQLEVLTAYEVL